jgi:uncharacterized repeat protein (TIGR01451 family)
MSDSILSKSIRVSAVLIMGILLVAAMVLFARQTSRNVLAAPIPPPAGYPKLTLSTKVVSPTLVYTDGQVLNYSIEIVNTGAYAAQDVTLVDAIPTHTTYNDDVWSSAPPTPVISDGVIQWQHGVVGFDASVVITFSVTVTPGYEGIVSNTAVISDPAIASPVTVTAETRVTDHPMLEIAKTATPDLPGANQPLTYELVVTNQGQAALNLPITVTDYVPGDTTFRSVGPGGYVSPDGDVVTWTRSISLGFGDTTAFTFSVDIGDVASGTVINNDVYQVSSEEGISAGEPYTLTVTDPIFILSKGITPDPPGSNSEMTYTLTVLNLGSRATDLIITDEVPPDVTYLRGGSYSGGVVTWNLPSLDPHESAQVTFTVFISDVAALTVLNENYSVCADEVCADGLPVHSLIVGPVFEVQAYLEPIAKKPGGGTGPVTPTLVVENIGPGNAIDATALVTFGRISVSLNDMMVIPPVGTLVDGPGCGTAYPCTNFVWTGNIAVGDMITFTTIEGQSTIGGEEGMHYTATLVVTDSLSGYVTEPITGTAIGNITHYANLVPTKSAPAEIGPGQEMTYTIQVFDSGLSTDSPPYPFLTETVPASVTLLSISDGGISETIDGRTMISWTLPAMGPGDYFYRSFSVLVDADLLSGTLIVNDEYGTTWYETQISGTLSNPGEPITTVVHEVGLIDSFKVVSPTWALPGTGTVLTYVLHVANSGPSNLNDVQLYDLLPWEDTTYQRDAVASSGSLISDIVSLEWTGDVAPYSETLITFTVLVDDYFEGVITNTATITHSSLQQDVVVTAVAYITNDPVLRIYKTDSPDPVLDGGVLLYQIHVLNLGQQATLLVITDTIPINTEFVQGSASSGGQLVGNVIQWNMPVLNPGESLVLTFQVTVLGGDEVVNDSYAVKCDEGVYAYGPPVYTRIRHLTTKNFLPLAFK